MTVDQLLGFRRDLADLRQAKRILTDQRLTVPVEVDTEIAKLTDWVVLVDVPCLLCRRTFPVRVAVNDPQDTQPYRVVCHDCDQKTTHG